MPKKKRSTRNTSNGYKTTLRAGCGHEVNARRPMRDGLCHYCWMMTEGRSGELQKELPHDNKEQEKSRFPEYDWDEQ